MSNQLSKEELVGTSVARYAATRTVSSKINAVLTSLMLTYTNILIHHLLKAGKRITIYNLNLLAFRVSDIMRAKLQCEESSFINILKTMYLLDDDPKMEGKFKLIRIKNKLNEPANNIIINYLFQGKIPCELQLSVQEPKGKAKNNYVFSHFIYELMRGRFGPIAECGIMISQLDPMVTVCNYNYYR